MVKWQIKTQWGVHESMCGLHESSSPFLLILISCSHFRDLKPENILLDDNGMYSLEMYLL